MGYRGEPEQAVELNFPLLLILAFYSSYQLSSSG